MLRNTSVEERLPWINDWCTAIGLHIRRDHVRSGLWLNAVVPGPPRTEGLSKATTIRFRAMLPVTNDEVAMLALLGFEDPESTLEALRMATTDRMACAILCGSRLFRPSLVINTAGGKFAGYSKLCSYARDTWGHAVGAKGDPHDGSKERELVHRVIERRFPAVVGAKEAFCEHERMLGQLQETLWGPSLLMPSEGGERRNLPLEHQRWKRFLELRGLQPLCAADPAAALEDWVRFREDGSHDWTLPTYPYFDA